MCVVLHASHFGEIVYEGTARTRALEPLALAGVAGIFAGTLPAYPSSSLNRTNPAQSTTFGRLIFSFSMVVFGIQHFLYAAFIATLIPSWNPRPLFWVYLAGVGFIAAGLAIFTHVGDRPAALMLALMFLLWMVVLHSPRVAASIHNGDEWSSLFVALSLGGEALIAAQASAAAKGSA